MQTAITNGRDPETIFVGGMDGQIEALELLAEGGGEGGIYRASGALILDDLGRAGRRPACATSSRARPSPC